jgi:diacylglycerol kinase (ATP)
VLFNRRALAARALRSSGLEGALRERGLQYDLLDADTPAEAREAAEHAARGGRIVIAAGGDGTAREVAHGVLASGWPDAIMGHVPLGTGNDLSRTLGRVGLGLKRALDAIVELRVSRMDVVQVNRSEYSLNAVGIGFDAEVARRRCEQPNPPRFYFPGTVRAIVGYKPQSYRLRWPDGELEGQATMIAAMNGAYEGGGVPLAPGARLDDGLVEVYWIDPVTLRQFARYVWAVRWGKHDNLPLVKHGRAQRLSVESEARLQYHLDGEYREMAGGGTLEIEVLPRRLAMIV